MNKNGAVGDDKSVKGAVGDEGVGGEFDPHRSRVKKREFDRVGVEVG